VKLPLGRVPDPGFLAVALSKDERVIVIRRGTAVTVLEDECPHQGLPLSVGELCDDGTIECPWHGARFDAATGACVRGPATDSVAVYEVRVEDGLITIGSKRRPG
jgi:nitrite reductase/ring-hydroxylating ferredoxin subunit